MLLQELQLLDLNVQIHSEQVTDQERIRVIVTRGFSGGVAQIRLPEGGDKDDRENLINLIASTAIREICAELDGSESCEYGGVL